MFKTSFFLINLLLSVVLTTAQPSRGYQTKSDFVLAAPGHVPVIFVDKNEQEVVRIAADALAKDIRDITGIQPAVTSDADSLKIATVILGTPAHNQYISGLCQKHTLPPMAHDWEHFIIRGYPGTSQHPATRVLVIAGSDARGAAFGAFTLSGILGVSPWTWWADVTPLKKSILSVRSDIHIDERPSVKYRGIFLNDEDWGLRPWASKTFDPRTGTLGPKTYAKIFELLLRLKANTIWPAMHPGTKPFFQVPGNREQADRYDMVIGTSHAEPMLRNNVGEWDEKTMGAFNYVTNRDTVYRYWEQRVREAAGSGDIFTLGMRGIHDSKMEGAATVSQEAKVLNQVIEDQRGLLKKYVNPDVTKVPQVFIPYKEVLPVYNYGLTLPGDITLMWTDDNYGYIRRLSNQKEQRRSGSAGVYYHLSYWGRPHDYLWLSTTQPALIWEELNKAWDYGAKRIWIANVGDIKPAEYNIEFFLDMAWNIHAITPDNLSRHMEQWAARDFGAAPAKAIAGIMQAYYRLAFIRRPEFMGWSQTEPTTKTRSSDFNPFRNGDEIARRLSAYQNLVDQVGAVARQIPASRRDAFFELVAYPVKGAALMNEKFLEAQKSRLFVAYGLPVANRYSRRSKNAYDSIKSMTRYYNHVLAGGKWENIMDMAPRGLPVYQLPPLPDSVVSTGPGVLLWPEGSAAPLKAGTPGTLTLPPYNPYTAKRHFIDLVNRGAASVRWQAHTPDDWIVLDEKQGILDDEYKLGISIDWHKVPAGCTGGLITLEAGRTQSAILVPLEPAIKGKAPGTNPLVEQDGHVFIQAADFSGKYDHSKQNKWQVVNGLGFSGRACMILPVPQPADRSSDSSFLAYRFYTYSRGAAQIKLYTLPTHPVGEAGDIRVGVSVDGGALQVLSFKTTGRSETWKQDVLRNQAISTSSHSFPRPGWHTLRVYALDPGVIIDQIQVDFKPKEHFYTVPAGE